MAGEGFAGLLPREREETCVLRSLRARAKMSRFTNQGTAGLTTRCPPSLTLDAGREDSPPVFSSGLTHDQVWNYSCRWVCLRSSHVRDARWYAASVLCSLTPAPSATSSAFTETAEGLQSAHASRSLFGAGSVESTARAQNESETASLQPLPPPVAQVRGSKSQGLLAPRQHDTIPVSVNEDVGITW